MRRSKTIRQAVLIALASLGVFIAAAFVLAHTGLVARYVRGKIAQAAESKLGVPIHIRKVSFAWDHLGVTFHDITIQGRGAESQPPFFHAPKLTVQLEFAALLHGKFHLGKVALDHPVVRVRTPKEGPTNVPTVTRLPSSGSSSSASSVTSLFHLTIRRLIIHQGTIDYQNAEIPLSVDLADFGANVRFDTRSHTYRGTLGYRDGRIRTKHFAPAKTTATLQFSASRSGIVCQSLIVTIPNSRLRVYATLQNYSDPHLAGRYTAELATRDVGQILGNTWLPTGKVRTSGTIHYHRVPSKSFLESLQLNGTLGSSQLRVRMKQFAAPVRSLEAAYSLENGTLRIVSLQGNVLGGKLVVNRGELHLMGTAPSRLDATLTGISLPDLSDALPSGPYHQLSLAGRAKVIAQLAWASHFHHWIVHSRVAIHSQAQRALPTGRIPLNGVVEVAYDQARDRASFGNSYLRIGDTTISARGRLSKHSNLAVKLSTTKLDQLTALAVRMARAIGSTPSTTLAWFEALNLSGDARFDGRVYGSLEAPRLDGSLLAQNVRVRSVDWRTMQTTFHLSPSSASFHHGLLIAEKRGSVTFEASFGLRHWSLTPSSPMALRATVAELPMGSLQSLANVSYPVGGTVSADLSIRGTRERPSGEGWVRVVHASAWRQPLTLATAHFHGGPAALQATLAVESPAGDVHGNLLYDTVSKHYQLTVSTPGIEIAKIERVRSGNWGIKGTLLARASGQGTLGNPQIAATLSFPHLELRGQNISDATWQLALANRRLDFTAHAEFDQGRMQASGAIELTGTYRTSATLDLRRIAVATVLASYVPQAPPGLHGSADVHAEIQGPLKNPSQLLIRAEVPALSFEYQSMHAALVHPLQMEYRDGIATLQKSEIQGKGIDLTLQGAIPVQGTAPFKLAANGTVDLNLLQQIATGIQSSGQAQLDITGEGSLSNPTLQGDLRLRNVSVASTTLPLVASGIRGDMRLSGHRLEIATLTGNVNGGSMTAQGAVLLGTQPTFDLAVDAKSVDLNYPSGIRTRLDCTLRYNGALSHSALTGRIVIDDLGFTRPMDVTSLASQFTPSGGISTPRKFEKETALNIAIQSSSTLRLASRQLRVEGAANLDVVGTLADPVVLGRATLTGGELFFLGKRYEINSGILEFTNPTRTRPSVNLYASTTVNQYNISLHFLGPVDEMRTSFTSTPALPQADIINLLAFGRTTEPSAASNATPATLGAESVLAQGVASQISGKIQKLAGISQLSITPILANGQQNPGAQVAIQQRVTGRLLVTFTTNTAATQSTAVQVQYRLAHGLSISALRDQFGGYGVDVHLHKTF